MKETSRISSSRALHGSRPSTFNFPSYDVSPRIAFSAVVFPAPFGPINPRIRPSSTRKSIPSSAFVAPYTFRTPLASMHAIASAFLLFLALFFPTGSRRALCIPVEQFFRPQPQSLDRRAYPRPLFLQKILSLALQQKLTRASLHEHSNAPPALDQLLVH